VHAINLVEVCVYKIKNIILVIMKLMVLTIVVDTTQYNIIIVQIIKKVGPFKNIMNTWCFQIYVGK